MTDLDTRAREAAAALKESVTVVDLRLTEPPTVRTATRAGWLSNPAWAMAAGAVTALVLLLGIWSLRPTVVADDTSTTTTTITTTTTLAPTTEATAPPTTTAPVAPVAPPTTEAVDTVPPVITITSPTDGQVFTGSRITFAGTTEPGAEVFGGPYQATVAADGTWSIVLILSEGANTATFRAVDAAGNEGFATVTAVYEPPAPPKEPEIAPFTAHNTFGECSENPPFDEYYGTGQPGSTVQVISNWGSGVTAVKEDGSWYLKVFFPDAPYGNEFQVKAKDQYGRYQYFGMTRTG